MEEPCLKDENEYPDDDVLSRHLGEVKESWDTFINFISEEYPSFSGEWRYYKDGKNWLFKVTKKKKTVCWVSVCNKMFRTTFYFSDKAEEMILNSKLEKNLIDSFVQGKKYGKIRGLTVNIKKTSDLEATKTLIEIKEKLK